MKGARAAEWVLRVGVALEFCGHGLLALQGEPKFSQFIAATMDVDPESTAALLMGIGLMDLVVAGFALVWPARIVLVWASCWGFLTALLRPITGHSVLAFIELAANWAAPLALLLLRGLPRTRRDWWR